MHSLLERQLRRFGVTEKAVPSVEAWQEILAHVSRTYVESDRGRQLLERSLAISSQEMQTLYLQLKETSETQLAQERNQLRAVLRSLGEGSLIGIWDWQVDTDHCYFSPEWKRQIGFGESEFADSVEVWRSHLHPQDRSRAFTAIEDHLAGRAPRFELEYRLRHRDGSWIWLLCRGALVADGEARPKRMVGVHIDLTERKEGEARLRQAKETAEAASRAKSEFLANMSHEIRTPMNGVLGMTELLLATHLDGRQRHLAQQARNSGAALLALLNDILDVSKVEAGKLHLESVAFDLRRCLKEVHELMAPAAQRKSLSLKCNVFENVPAQVRGDPTRCRQIALNLVGNAIKFTEKGGVDVMAEALGETATAVTLSISVRDTGIGIDAAAQAAIFAPFSQADTSTTRKYGGTGLGLTIVRQLANLMGGTVEIQSTLGVGSLFRFVASFAKVVADTARTPSAESSCAVVYDETAVSAAPMRLLVVDDCAISRELASGMLEALGIRADLTSSGEEAVAAVEQQGYDLVLMDCQMPGMDGLMAAQSIRRTERRLGRKRSFIVALTAFSTLGHRERCLAAGMDEYLTKPFSLDEFSQILAACRSTGKTGQEPIECQR